MAFRAHVTFLIHPYIPKYAVKLVYLQVKSGFLYALYRTIDKNNEIKKYICPNFGVGK